MIKKDMSIEEYHSNPFIVSSTGLKKAKKSSRDFAWYLLFDKERKSHFDFGNAFEIALLDGANGTKEYDSAVTIFDPDNRPDQEKGMTSKVNQTWKKDILESGKYVINAEGKESQEYLNQMVDSCLSDPTIEKLIKNSDYQTSLFWDHETGVKCKTRPDLDRQKKKVIVDIKTSLTPGADLFPGQCAKLDYPLSAIMQMQGCLKTGYMDDIEAYYWLVAGKEPPFHAALYEFQKDDWDWITDQYEFCMNRVAKVINAIREGGEDFSMWDLPSVGEAADNKYGVMQMSLPLWYRHN